MQGLVVVGLIVEEILNVVKVTGAQNIGRHWVKVSAESVHPEEALCKVWWLCRPYSLGDIDR